MKPACYTRKQTRMHARIRSLQITDKEVHRQILRDRTTDTSQKREQPKGVAIV